MKQTIIPRSGIESCISSLKLRSESYMMLQNNLVHLSNYNVQRMTETYLHNSSLRVAAGIWSHVELRTCHIPHHSTCVTLQLTHVFVTHFISTSHNQIYVLCRTEI